MSTKICHVLYPGAFKPVHYGHIALMNKYLNSKEYSVKLTVIISRSPREGISAESSKYFLYFKSDHISRNQLIQPWNIIFI